MLLLLLMLFVFSFFISCRGVFRCDFLLFVYRVSDVFAVQLLHIDLSHSQLRFHLAAIGMGHAVCAVPLLVLAVCRPFSRGFYV